MPRFQPPCDVAHLDCLVNPAIVINRLELVGCALAHHEMLKLVGCALAHHWSFIVLTPAHDVDSVPDPPEAGTLGLIYEPPSGLGPSLIGLCN